MQLVFPRPFQSCYNAAAQRRSEEMVLLQRDGLTSAGVAFSNRLKGIVLPIRM